MSLNAKSISGLAAQHLVPFQKRVAGIPYERKGVLYSEMYFLYLCAQAAKPRRILESGRARGQSTLLLSTAFPDLPIVSVEHDPDSPDNAVAQARLRGRTHVDLRYGDATRLLPLEARPGDIVLIDGPKGFRGLRLALRLLATGKLQQVFVHDCTFGSAERAFLQARVPGVLYSDAIDYARVARVLDADCWESMPSDRRFDGDRAPPAYGYGLACIPFDATVSYRALLLHAAIAGFRQRYLKRRTSPHD